MLSWITLESKWTTSFLSNSARWPPFGVAIAPQVVVDQSRFSRAHGPEHADQRVPSSRFQKSRRDMLRGARACRGRIIDLVDPLPLGKVEVGKDVFVLKAPGKLRRLGRMSDP